MLNNFRRGRRGQSGFSRGFRSYRPTVEALEDRRLLAAPVINAIPVALNIPTGKTLVFPLSGGDPAGGSVTYAITTDNPGVTVTSHPGNTFLKLSVSFTNAQGAATTGDMVFELFGDLTPQTVNLISGFVKNEFYNGLTFHRIISGFVIQGGDPAGNGTGGPGFTFDDEFNPNLIYSGSGQLGLANSGKDTNGSQFFITDGPQRSLDFNNGIFGQLIRGFDVLKAIEAVPVQAPNNNPVTPVVITSAQIIPDTTDAVFTLNAASTVATGTTVNLTVTATSSTGGTTTETVPAKIVADVVRDKNGNPLPGIDGPILGPVSNQVSPINATVTIPVTATDLENDQLDFSDTRFQGTPPTGTSAITVTSTGTNTATISFTPPTGFQGPIQVLVQVKDSGATARGSTDNPDDSQLITVAIGDQALTATGVAFTGTEGTSSSGTVATFIDPDTAATAADFKASINWGDGTAPDTTGHVTGSGGNFTLSGTHTYKEAGKFAVSATITDSPAATTSVTDKGGAIAKATQTATVADAALVANGVPLTVGQGTALNNVNVANFVDADPGARASDFTAAINWGDGISSPGTVTAASSGGFFVLGSHTYNTAGSFTVAATITDVNTAGDVPPATATTSATATVTGPIGPPAPTGTPNQRFVKFIYTALLGRTADSGGLTFFSNGLDQGQFSTFQVVLDIQTSTEGRIRQVQNLFLQLVGHVADSQTLGNATVLLDNGGTLSQLAVLITSSPEYFQSHGGGTNSGFVSALYRDGLNRSVDAGTLSTATQAMANGYTQAEIAAVVFTSAEFQQDLVQTIYQLLLQRPADPTGLATFTTALAALKLNDDLIIATIGSSQEAFNLAQNVSG